jgi:hypothetical protein
MSKIFRQSESKEIEHFLSTNERVSPVLKKLIQEELHSKGEKYKDSYIWLILRSEAFTIDVFDIKGDIFETDTYYFKDFPTNL